MGLMVSVAEALKRASANDRRSKDPVEEYTYLLIADTLFSMANKPDPKVRGSIRRAVRAQKIILQRMVGKRVSGSHPATRATGDAPIEFVDLTSLHLDPATPQEDESRNG